MTPQPGQIWAHLGTILGLKLGLCCAMCGKKVLKSHLENMLFPNIIFKEKSGFLEPLLDTKNQAKP